MQQHQKSINSKGHLSAQHSMLPGPVSLDQRPFRQAQYRILPCFTGAGRNTPEAEFLGSCAVSELRAGYKAHPKQGAASCWALYWHSNPSSSNGSHSFFGVRPTYTSYNLSSHCNINVHFGVSTAQSWHVLFFPSIHLCGEGYKSSLSRGSLLFKIILAHWLMPSLDDSDSEQGK